MSNINKAMYLVTDPCYIISRGAAWHKFLDWFYGKADVWSEHYKVEGFGTILRAENCHEVDIKVGKGKEMLSDSGTMCVVELDEGVTPSNYNGTAVTDNKDKAFEWCTKAAEWGQDWGY